MKQKVGNKGVTLIELLVTIAILSVMVGVSTLSLSLIHSKDAVQAARTMEGELSTLRMYSKNKEGDWCAIITNTTAEKSVSVYQTTAEGQKLIEKEDLPNRVAVFYSSSADSDKKQYSYAKIVFDHTRGSVKAVLFGNDFTALMAQPDNTSSVPAITYITTSNEQGNKTAEISLIKVTGKHFVEE